MITLYGKSVCQGICIGKLFFYRRPERNIQLRTAKNRDAEWRRMDEARKEACIQLQRLHESAARQAGAENAEIFEMQKMLLEDCGLVKSLRDLIYEQGVNAEYAVKTAGEKTAQMLFSTEDAYIRDRARDVQDITERLLNLLLGEDEPNKLPEEPCIVVSDDLMPSETVRLPKGKVLGFAMRGGSVTSHTAILAAGLGIPALFEIGWELSEKYEGQKAIIDGCTGSIYIQPDQRTLVMMQDKDRRAKNHRNELLHLKGMENVTRDGRKIKIFANAGGLADVESAWENDAGGIGLLRSELLYLGRISEPDEETQFDFYRQALERMKDREVIIRTMDIGADKQVPYLELEREENPALGMRAVRICLEKPALLKTQLRALYRAGMYGRLSIMYPMITSTQEIRELRCMEKEVKEELVREGIPFKEDIPTGIMIETPAAAVISDELAGLVDFFSVGTNDLTQYTLAVDRCRPGMKKFADPHHRAVMRLIEYTANNAHKAGIWIGICGELAADMSLTEKFIGMGIDELSVPPSLVLPLRERIRAMNLSK